MTDHPHRWRLPGWLPWVLFALLLVPTGFRIAARREKLSRATYPDFQIFFQQAKRAQRTGTLYQTEEPDLFTPGSRYYKFPPPVAAFLSLLEGRFARRHTLSGVIVSLTLLVLSFALLVATLKPTVPRLLLMLLVFLNWLPFMDCLGALAVEPVILLMLALALVLAVGRRFLAAAVPLGIGAALKIYPGGLVLYFLVRRRWRAVWGALIGAVATFGVAALILPLRHTVEYFLEVFPRLGGASLSYENMSLFGNLGRLAILLLAGRTRVGNLSSGEHAILAECGVAGAHLLALALVILLCAGLALAIVKVVRRSGPLPRGISESLGLSLATCLYLLLLPTSWTHYQVLLILPVLVGIAFAPSVRREPAAWILLALAILPAILLSATRALPRSLHPPYSIARSLIPLWLSWALLRIWRARAASVEPGLHQMES